MTTTTNSPESHPYQVGKVVYETLEVATDRANTAAWMHSTTVVVLDRRTGEIVHLCDASEVRA